MIKNIENNISRLKESITYLEKEKIELLNIIKNKYIFLEQENKITLLTKDNKKLFIKTNDEHFSGYTYTFLNQNIWTKEIFLDICKIIEIDIYGSNDEFEFDENISDFKFSDLNESIKIFEKQTKESYVLRKYIFPKNIDNYLLLDLVLWYLHKTK